MGLSMKNVSVGKIKATLKKAEEDVKKAGGQVTEPIKKAITHAVDQTPLGTTYHDISKTLTKGQNDIANALKKGLGDTMTYFSTAKPLHKYNLEEFMTGKIRPNGDPLASTSDRITEQVYEPIKKKLNETFDGGGKKKGGAGDGRPDLQSVLDTVFGPGGGSTGTGGGAPGTGGAEGGAGGSTPITAPTFDPKFMEAQSALLGQLQDRVSGKTPSLAEMQYKQASNKAMQNTLGSVRAGIGSNAALAARTAALAGGNQMSDIAANSAMLRLKESQDAQNAIASLAAQGQQAQLGQQQLGFDVQKANQASQLTQMGYGADLQKAALDAKAKIAAAAMQPSPGGGGGGGGTDWMSTLLPIIATAVAGPVAGAATSAILAKKKADDEGNLGTPLETTPVSDAYAPVREDAPKAPAAAPDFTPAPAFTPALVSQEEVAKQKVSQAQDRAALMNKAGALPQQGLNAMFAEIAKQQAAAKAAPPPSTIVGPGTPVFDTKPVVDKVVAPVGVGMSDSYGKLAPGAFSDEWWANFRKSQSQT